MADMPNEPDIDVSTALGFIEPTRWRLIVNVKHPVMNGRERDVADALLHPDEIRRSLSDPDVYLFYRMERPARWLCVVVKQRDDEGFVITTYPTDTIKVADTVLCNYRGIVVTSDSVVLDRCGAWTNLAAAIVDTDVRSAWKVDLSNM